jgi:uncharacterized integral membrane protein
MLQIAGGVATPAECTRRKFGRGLRVISETNSKAVRSVAVFGWIAALFLGVALALFAVQNQQATSVQMLGTVYDGIPVWLVMVASALLGAIMVVLISLVDRLRWFVDSRHSKKVLLAHKKMIVERDNRIHELEQEIFRLRGAA